MSKRRDLAIFGAGPLFQRPIETGQGSFPTQAQYEAIFRDIFERQYYTNHGPLAQKLERHLAERLGVRHAMCVTNEFIGLVSAGQALGIHHNVVVPAHCSVATVQSLNWTDARPVFCDVDKETGMMTAETVAPVLARHSITAILAVNPWGDACDVQGLEALADLHGIPLYFDSANGFGCAIEGRPVGSFGAIEVISFNSDNVLSSCEGGVVCTQSDELAAHIRNTRSSYGMGPSLLVSRTGNGRMSEAQAAVALFNLDHYSEYRHHNQQLFEMFRIGLRGIPGLEVRVPSGVSESNHQNLICLVDETNFGLRRDDLWRILRAENIRAGRGFYPPLHRLDLGRACEPITLRHTDHYCACTIELPVSQVLSEPYAARIIELLGWIQLNAGVIRNRLPKAA